MNMFTEIILDCYRHPKSRGTITDPDFAARDTNPLCGDVIAFTGRVTGGRIAELKHDGHGCAISQAAAELLAEQLEGKPVDAVRTFRKEDLLKLLNIDISPVRLKCALLGLKVLKLAAYQHLGETLSQEEASL